MYFINDKKNRYFTRVIWILVTIMVLNKVTQKFTF